ncbi:cytochrome c oxidase assembly protein [Stutzerimonas azotifigens]|uniref:cytochrome c oxidase assembly protein n=1 Tax=Stutzerimonas azotifigens TaxID=291995 RepID=UPI0004120264|nr:cytochrome c oxidase assembly protein [Stutzerimonas azotifigens]
MKRLALLLGALTLAMAWLGPLPALAERAFAAHMAMHVLVVAVAAPLLALGLANGRLDPVQQAPRLFSPALASLVELVVVWGWHAPALHHAARHSSGLLALEQLSYLAVGLLLWLSAFGGSRRRDRAAAGIAGLLLTSMHMTLLGVLLALAGRPLYAHAALAADGLSALDDQHLGGVIMLVFGGCSYLAGGLYLLAGLLREKTDVASAR